MFYGMNEAQQQEFQRALAVIRGIYRRNFAGDMLIALDKNMGFMEEPRFVTAVAAQYLDFGARPKRWYLYDTFEGIPAPDLDPGHINPREYQEPGLHDAVVRRFADYPNIGQHRGRVPEVLHGSAPQKIAF